MRLNPLLPKDMSADVLALHNEMASAMQQNQPGVAAQAACGALTGPFIPMLHFPQFGRGLWEGSKIFLKPCTLPDSIRQVAILAVGAQMNARFEIYSHEIVAESAGLSRQAVAALAAGERPAVLLEDQAIAFNVARALVGGKQLPASTYHLAVAAFGEEGAAELIFMVGSYLLLAVIINGYDLAVPGE